MPPIPPPGMSGEPKSFFGLSATIASVVTSRPATELASCKATLTTLAGSMMPFPIRSPYSPVWASKPKDDDLWSVTLPTTNRRCLKPEKERTVTDDEQEKAYQHRLAEFRRH